MSKIIKPNYVNLHLHTEFSALDGFARIDDHKDKNGKILMQGITSKLIENGQKACAITDHASLSAIQPAYGSFSKAGIKLLPGCEFYIVPDMTVTKGMNNHIVVIAKNHEGWKNILRMNYIAYEQGAKEVFSRRIGRIEMSVLEKYSEGLLISSACLAGIPAWALKTDDFAAAEDHIRRMQKLFPESYYLEVHGVDYYDQLDIAANTPLVDREWIEMQATDQKRANDRIIDIAEKLKVPLVAATDAHYVNAKDRMSHLLMLAIQSKKDITSPTIGSIGGGGRLAFEATPMLSGDNMVKMFTEKESGYNGYAEDQVKEWMRNTELAAEMVEEPSYLAPSGYKIPPFPVKESEDFTEFSKWKDSLEEDQINNILDNNGDYLKSRLILDEDG